MLFDYLTVCKKWNIRPSWKGLQNYKDFVKSDRVFKDFYRLK